MFRNIIWDVDGTLFDTYPAITQAIKAALNELGQDASLTWITQLARESLSHCCAVLADHFRLDTGALDQVIDQHFERITADQNPPFPGVLQLCQRVSSSQGRNVIVTHRGRKSTLELLNAHKLIGYFSGCITRDDGYPRKPDPSAFHTALADFHLSPAETLTIGDRQIDILAGQAAGLFSCFFGSAADGVNADLVISRFDELDSYLAKTDGTPGR